MHWIDPDCLPETLGVVDLYLLNAEGEADGLVLTDGTEIHFPPHMGGAVLDTVKPGSAVRIRDVRPRGVAMVAAVSMASEAGPCIVDQGSPEKRRPPSPAREPARAARTPIEAEGVLRQVLHGPRGGRGG